MGKSKEVRENMGKQEDQLKGVSGNLSGLADFFQKERDDALRMYKKLNALVRKLKEDERNNVVIPKEKRASKEMIALARKKLEKLIEDEKKFL